MLNFKILKYRPLLIIALVFVSFGVASTVLAHQPRYVTDDQLVLIKNPSISQAFYGELKNRPAYYLIDLKEAQSLYFQILVPALAGIQKDKAVTVNYISNLTEPAKTKKILLR